jgi:hypothetical protein
MSPLLVTIFLVAFAVALGAMVMSWGSNAGTRDSSSCKDVEISPQVVSGSELICYDASGGKVKVVISNTGGVALDAVINRQVSSDFSINDISIPASSLGIGQVLSTDLFLVPGPMRIELIPAISVLNERVICTSKALIREDISPCT